LYRAILSSTENEALAKRSASGSALLKAAIQGESSEVNTLLVYDNIDANVKTYDLDGHYKRIAVPTNKGCQTHTVFIIDRIGEEHDYTALMHAVKYGHVEIVEALLRAGANEKLQGHDKKTAIDLTQNLKILELIDKAPLLRAEGLCDKLVNYNASMIGRGFYIEFRSRGMSAELLVDHLVRPRENVRHHIMILRQAIERNKDHKPNNALSEILFNKPSHVATIKKALYNLLDAVDHDEVKSHPMISSSRPYLISYGPQQITHPNPKTPVDNWREKSPSL
jgi:hypothetical protein